MNPGIYPSMSAADYHAADAIGSSGLRRILRSPAHLVGGAQKAASPDMDQGTLIHTAVLEPEHFEERVIICDARRGTKAWKEAEEQAAESGGIVSKPEPVEIALAVRDAVHARAHINRLVCASNRYVEHSAFAVESCTGVFCKVRPDLVVPYENAMVDLKSTRDADAKGFAKSIAQYRYHFQAAMYLDIWRQATRKMPHYIPTHFIFLAVEKEPPYAAALYELNPLSLREGETLYRMALEKYALCRERDDWPGYPAEVVTLSLPSWGFEALTPNELTGPLGFPID